MRRTELLKEIRTVRFEEVYGRRDKGWLTQEGAPEDEASGHSSPTRSGSSRNRSFMESPRRILPTVGSWPMSVYLH